MCGTVLPQMRMDSCASAMRRRIKGSCVYGRTEIVFDSPSVIIITDYFRAYDRGHVKERLAA